jgi:hypothetical protein
MYLFLLIHNIICYSENKIKVFFHIIRIENFFHQAPKHLHLMALHENNHLINLLLSKEKIGLLVLILTLKKDFNILVLVQYDHRLIEKIDQNDFIVLFLLHNFADLVQRVAVELEAGSKEMHESLERKKRLVEVRGCCL